MGKVVQEVIYHPLNKSYIEIVVANIVPHSHMCDSVQPVKVMGIGKSPRMNAVSPYFLGD